MSLTDTGYSFNFGGEGRICGLCEKEAKFIRVDNLNDLEVYECPCGHFQYTKPAIENKNDTK